MEVTRARAEAAEKTGIALSDATPADRTADDFAPGGARRAGRETALPNRVGKAGRTASAARLAGELVMAGNRVALRNADLRGAALDWAQRRLYWGLKRTYGVFGTASNALHLKTSRSDAQAVRPPQPPEMPAPMRVSLAYVAHRVNVWLRFGQPEHEIVLDRWRRVAVLAPGAVCCRVKWIGNEHGTALWQLMVLQAPMPFDAMQRVAGVTPGARILLRVDGETRVKAVLETIDVIESMGVDPRTVAATYWRIVGNRLAARQLPPDYSAERHAAHLARWKLQ